MNLTQMTGILPQIRLMSHHSAKHWQVVHHRRYRWSPTGGGQALGRRFFSQTNIITNISFYKELHCVCPEVWPSQKKWNANSQQRFFVVVIEFTYCLLWFAVALGKKKLNAMNIKLWRVGCMQSSILIHMGPLFLMQISHCCFSHAFFSSKSPSLVQVSLHQHWIHSFHCHDDCHSSSSKRDCVPSHPCQLLGCCTTPKKMLGDCVPLRGGMIKDSQRHVNVQSSSRLNFA